MSWEEREAKKSLSKLIKGEQNSLFRIESFEVEEIIQDPLQEESYQEKLARMEKEAYQKGFEQGQRDGLSLEEKQMGEKAKQLETIFVGLNDLKAQIYHETESELLQMSILMAKKIIREEIKTDGGIIRNTIQAALKFLVDKQHIRIRLNPEDMEETRKLLPELAAKTKGGQFQMVEDHAIESGGCILETGFGRINATIEDQLGELEKEIEEEFRSTQIGSDGTLPG